MAKYILKRIGMALLSIFIVTTLTFFLMHSVPGGPFVGDKAVPVKVLAALNAKYGFDQPVFTQYLKYLGGLTRFDFGVSLKQKGVAVTSIIFPRFALSFKIGITAAILAVIIGVPLGSLAAVNRGKTLDRVIMVLATASVSIPSFVLASLLMLWLGGKMGLPVSFNGSFAGYILPVISMMLYPTAYITRLMRSSMLDVLDQDYIRTARAKGVLPRRVLFKHSLRNAILPVLTYMGPMLAFIILGSFAVETVFSVPGLGRSFVQSALNRDYFLIMGTTIFLAMIMIFMNLIIDILYTLVDPRVSLG